MGKQDGLENHPKLEKKVNSLKLVGIILEVTHLANWKNLILYNGTDLNQFSEKMGSIKLI